MISSYIRLLGIVCEQEISLSNVSFCHDDLVHGDFKMTKINNKNILAAYRLFCLRDYLNGKGYLIVPKNKKNEYPNSFQPTVALLYPLKTPKKPLGFLMFSRGIVIKHWAEMG